MTIKNDGVNLSPLHMFFSLFLILLNSNWLYCYRGVYRFPNGTDVELYRLNNGACEKVLLGEKRHDPVPNYCGYECNRNLNQTSSVYKLKNVISGCEKDFLILQNERCSVAIGTNWKKNEVNTIEIHNIDKKFLYYKNTKASRCTLKNECSVKYRNFTSGWQVFSYGDCFKFEVVDDNSKATAQININCVPAHQKHLAGQMFRIELECHMDSQNKTVDTCLLFKIPGLYIVNDSISLLSTQVCVTPLPPVIPTTADPLKSDDNFMSPYGWIIIGVILALILLAIIICIFIYCSRKKRYNVDSKSESQGDHPDITITPSPDDPDPTALHQSYKHKTASMNSNVMFVQGSGDNPSFEMNEDMELPDLVDSNWNIPTENPYEDPYKSPKFNHGSDRLLKFNQAPGGEINCTVNGTMDLSPKHEGNSLDWNGQTNRNDNTPDEDDNEDDGYWNRTSETPILERRNNSLLRDEVLEHFGLDEKGNYKRNNYGCTDEEGTEDAYKVTDLLENYPSLESEQIIPHNLPLGRKQSSQKINFHEENVIF